jgi:hypothetical protein
LNDRHFSRLRGLSLASALLLSLLTLLGCLGATRLPARSRGPGGNIIEPKQVELGFIQAGTTKRQEVLDKLSPIDTGYSSPRLFWGRWANSKWGYWWILVAPSGPSGGGGGAGAGNAKRLWHLQNLVVSFDENGVVRSNKEFEDDKSLWRELHGRLPDLAPLDLTQLLSIPLGRHGDGGLTVGEDFIEVHRSKKSPARIPFSSVLRISHDGTPDKNVEPGLTCHTLHFSEKTAVGSKLRFCAEAPKVIAMFQYLHQAGPKDMQWE